MRIQPRRQLIETWKAVVQHSYPKDAWLWGGRSGRNSISDAEQLLCVLGPATSDDTFGIDRPDRTAPDLELSLRRIGDSIEIPRALLRAIRDYLREYSDPIGRPTFAGGSYFTGLGGREPEMEQYDLDVVDSFAVSIRLALAVIGFARVFRRSVQRDDINRDIDEVERLASLRLTAAMVGLLRAFTINVVDSEHTMGRLLISMLNQDNSPEPRVRETLTTQLADIRAGLRDMTLGIDLSIADDLANENKLFECGWTWGVSEKAAVVDTQASEAIHQPEGTAQAAPYLYFTVVGLDAIQHLFSTRTRMLTLLDEEQNRLARALQIRYDLTLGYWSRLARFGEGRWPLENLPWTTTDGDQSDYLSLLVTSIVVLEMSNNPGTTSDSAVRVGTVLEELAQRSRITRRPLSDSDPAIALHDPGYAFELAGSERGDGPTLLWQLTDFSTQLLKQVLRLALLARSVEARARMTRLADDVWDPHLRARRMRPPLDGLWDRPDGVYTSRTTTEPLPSWYYTERVVDCLVVATSLINSPPLPSAELLEQARRLLAEAEHVYDRELMGNSQSGPSMAKRLDEVESTLRRAREMAERLPGTAKSLVEGALVSLDRISAARRDGGEGY